MKKVVILTLVFLAIVCVLSALGLRLFNARQKPLGREEAAAVDTSATELLHRELAGRIGNVNHLDRIPADAVESWQSNTVYGILRFADSDSGITGQCLSGLTTGCLWRMKPLAPKSIYWHRI